jgi:GNAT superfamily N-acetyltransferase
MEASFQNYTISDDKSRLNFDTICGFLAQSYWANQRDAETIRQSLEHSICYGVYHEGRQIAFARIVTDHTTVYWLCDVFIDDEYRGQGIGKKLIETITQSELLSGLMGILATKDAHGLYEQYGFEKDAARFMRKPRI